MDKKYLEAAEKAFHLMHPVRLKLAQLLKAKPQSFLQISKELGISRQLTAFHLSYLETDGLLDSKYIILKEPRNDKAGKALRQYSLSIKAIKVVDWIESQLLKLK